ncbi:ABC transporter permease [Cryptosporangium minutisporangium]|uniref:Transport permease protein n=1 Tax=Cryptosporangium minutisporangium TaxID=113569 RepID=A0ABP6T3Y3_9ACTN
MSAFGKLLTVETKLFLREPTGLIFTLAVPVVVLVALGSVPSFREDNPDLGGASVIDLYVPILIGLCLATQAMNALPVLVATAREQGILRRMSATPVPPSRLLAAQTLVQVGVFVLMALLLLAIGRLAFGVPLPANPAAFVVAFLLAAGASFAVGMLLSAVLPNNRVATPVTMLIYFPMLFFAGLWLPREIMPDVINRIGDFTPLGAGVQAIRDASAGEWPSLLHVAVLLVITVAGATAASKLFRWV